MMRRGSCAICANEIEGRGWLMVPGLGRVHLECWQAFRAAAVGIATVGSLVSGAGTAGVSRLVSDGDCNRFSGHR